MVLSIKGNVTKSGMKGEKYSFLGSDRFGDGVGELSPIQKSVGSGPKSWALPKFSDPILLGQITTLGK